MEGRKDVESFARVSVNINPKHPTSETKAMIVARFLTKAMAVKVRGSSVRSRPPTPADQEKTQSVTVF